MALSRAASGIARRHGFVAAGVVAATRSESHAVFERWLAAGYHGEMRWLERDAGARRRFDAILPFSRAILAVAREVPPGGPGNVARYARGEDYHRIVRRALKAVVEELRPLAPPGAHFRVCVDTAPLLEREIAVRAGLGFLGKNGLLIVPGAGSHVVLGEVLTDVALAPTVAAAAAVDTALDRCGSCTACLDECPTSAFVEPRLLDARRCLSYLTIEKRGPFTPEEEAALGGRLFGCDVCQDVCPWNGAIPIPPRGEGPGPDDASLDPESVAALDEAGFARRFGSTAIWRATAEGLTRNARAAIGR